MRILIVEDDAETCAFIARGLTESGHVVVTAGDGRDGLFHATDGSFDVLIIDRMVPAIDGLSLVKMLRTGQCATPVLMLTAMGGIDDRVEGLEAGADDYLVKPFAFSELAARIQALARRPVLQADPARLSLGDIELDFARRLVRRAGRKVLLQPREFLLLAELMRNPGRIVTRTMLLERVWEFHFDPLTSVVETHISRLRAKIDKPFDHPLLHTVRNTGYSMHA